MFYPDADARNETGSPMLTELDILTLNLNLFLCESKTIKFGGDVGIDPLSCHWRNSGLSE